MPGDFQLAPDGPDARSRCPDCRGAGALTLLDVDLPTPTQVLLDGVPVDYCSRCAATGLAVVPRCECGAICGAPGQPCLPCASRENPHG